MKIAKYHLSKNKNDKFWNQKGIDSEGSSFLIKGSSHTVLFVNKKVLKKGETYKMIFKPASPTSDLGTIIVVGIITFLFYYYWLLLNGEKSQSNRGYSQVSGSDGGDYGGDGGDDGGDGGDCGGGDGGNGGDGGD